MPRLVDHQLRRRELVEATWAVIAKQGFEAVTLRAVAAEAGCTTGRITHYFDDRDALLVAALRSAHAAAGARMAAALSSQASPAERLRAVLMHALPLDPQARAEWKVWIAFWNLATSDRRLADEDTRRYREWSTLLGRAVAAVRDDQRRGRAEPNGTGETTVALLMSWVDGAGIRGTIHPTRATRAAIVTELDALLDRLGVLGPHAATRRVRRPDTRR